MASEQPSGLSPTALKVLPSLRIIMDALRKKATKPRAEYRDEMTEEYGDLETVQEKMESQENMVNLANRIIKGEATSGERIDFKLMLAEIRSQVTIDPNIDETVAGNFLSKLEDSVLGPKETGVA